MKKLNCNITIFDNLDKDSAWLLGLIAADGCIFGSGKNCSSCLNLTSCDKDVIVKAKSILKSEHKIGVNYSHNGKSKKYRITINNKELCDSLVKYQIGKRKSKTLTFSEVIPNELLSHFIRGYMDGDGWISLRGKYSIHIGFVGTKPFLESVVSHIHTYTGVYSPKISIHTKGVGGIYRVEYKSSRRKYGNVHNILDWIYKDADMYMDRKYKLYSKCLTLIDNDLCYL